MTYLQTIIVNLNLLLPVLFPASSFMSVFVMFSCVEKIALPKIFYISWIVILALSVIITVFVPDKYQIEELLK